MQHQLEIKTSILYIANMLLKMWENEILHKNEIFCRNKKIAPTFSTTNTSDFKPFTKENTAKIIC